ncbi:MAG: phosphoribosylaminoimidazolesuccinocarboxamide synthase [Nanoarchaeota archaeon]|nr:phosphoribosylaminoimidazolesuccinocarboxamide synthase [Nanoarchaeota archaeon]
MVQEKDCLAEERLLHNVLSTLAIPLGRLERSDYRSEKTLFGKVMVLVEGYVQELLQNKSLGNPSLEGESKKIFVIAPNLALVALKPTMYSFTFNRYGIVEGTDSIRLQFWRLFAQFLNEFVSETLLGRRASLYAAEICALVNDNILDLAYPFVSNYLGGFTKDNVRYAIIRYAAALPPIEVVWKNYFVGTMKHALKKVDQYNLRQGCVLGYESKLPQDIVRFDWRNPLPDKDECIPSDFADFYIDTKNAVRVARLTSYLLGDFLKKGGYELVDLCYFMNKEGNSVYSEITPDGMRIKKKECSYDKDLWRAGKDAAVITATWKNLYADLEVAYAKD